MLTRDLWDSHRAGRGFLHGWYAQNGESQQPRLGFVCVSEDVTGQFGLCGFKEHDHNLSPDERLIFSDERVPLYDATAQPAPPQSE